MSGGGGSKQVTTGYRYYFGILMGLGRGPVDSIEEITVGDKRAWIGSVKNQKTNLIDLLVSEGVIQKTRFIFYEISSAKIDTDGNGVLNDLPLAQPTTLSRVSGPIGVIQVKADGSFTFDAASGYSGPIPTLHYRVRKMVGGTEVANVEYTYSFGGIDSNGNILINAPKLFGGEEKEGGVKGKLDVYMGAQDQVLGGGYPVMRTGPIPGLRGVLSVFFDGMVCAMNPYPKPWKFRVRRTTSGWDGAIWYPEKAKIEIQNEVDAAYSHIHAMNPAHIIYECYTNRQWGRGLDRSGIDDASFRECADILHAERFGLCLRWTRKDSIKNFVKSVIDHIGASVFQSPRTGLITMRLVRGNYNVNNLPVFTTENGIKTIDSFEVSAINNAVNAVQVKYRCPVTNEDRTVTVGNAAARVSSGGAVNLMSKDYPGISVGSLASRVAQRELRAASTTIRRFEITFDRRGYFIEPGSVILIEDRTRGITRTAVRVGKIDVSNYRDGAIKVSALQDIFSMPEKSFTVPVLSTWEPPSANPCVSDQKVFEMPYFMLVRGMSAAELAYSSEDSGFLATVARQGSGVNAGYTIAVRQSAPTSDDDPTSTDYICN